LIPFIVAYIYGIIAADRFRYFPVTVISASLILLLSAIYFCHVICRSRSTSTPLRGMGRDKGIYPLMAGIVLTAISGFFYMLYTCRVPYNDVSRYATGEKSTILGMVDEPPEFSTKKVVVHVRAWEIWKGERSWKVSGKVRVTIYDPEAALDYGDVITLTGRLKEIRGFKNTGLFDYAGYMARQGIRSTMSIAKKENISKRGIGGDPLLRKIYGWREEIRQSIARGLSGPSSAILQALVVGATGDLAPEIRDRFTAAGVTHILSVSGSHLGFVVLLTLSILRFTLLHLPYRLLLRISLYMIPSKLAAIGTIPPVVFYSILSGGAIATIRSLIMALVFLIALLFEREGDTLNTLIVAALLILLWDPQALFDISFQLSFMAVLSMILVIERFHRGGEEDLSNLRRRFFERFRMLFLLTLSASLSTAPIVAHYFNQITWTGLISNLPVVPYVGFAVLPLGLLSGLLSLIFDTGVIPLAWLNGLLLDLLYRMVDFFSRFPLSVIYIPSPGILPISAFYLFLSSLLFSRKRWAKISSIISAISVTLLALGCVALAGDSGGKVRVTFLDVGQGDSALVEFPDGVVMIIDGGGTFSETFDIGRSVIAPYLWNKGIRKIDYVVLTHPQLDHVEGLTYLVARFQIGEVWTNGRRGDAAADFYKILRDRGIAVTTVYRGMKGRTIGGCGITFLNPPDDGGDEDWKNNDLSIVMRLVCNDLSLLFTGDVERKAMREIAESGIPIESTVIKVPHHGAKSSVEETFIAAVKPSIAIISAGYLNPYKHPSPEALSAYERVGATIYRTDRDGAVTIEAGDGKMRVQSYEEMTLREVEWRGLGVLFMGEMGNLQKVLDGLYRN